MNQCVEQNLDKGCSRKKKCPVRGLEIVDRDKRMFMTKYQCYIMPLFFSLEIKRLILQKKLS